jgi:cyanate permease
MIGVIGASIGPIPLGIAFDLLGDYKLTLFCLAMIPLLVGVLVQFLKDPKLVDKETVT